RERLQLLSVSGVNVATSGAYTLHLFVAGDVDGNGTVDGLDAAQLNAALGAHAGQPGYLAAADVNRDGAIDAADAHLLAGDYGFHANRPPALAPGSANTHMDLAVTAPLAALATDPENDPLFFHVGAAQHGTVRLSGDGTAAVFTPDPLFTGTA